MLWRHFRGLVEGVDAIVWEADPATFRITFVSRSVERLLGHPREHWYAQPLFWEEHIAPEHRERVLATAQAHLAAGEDYELEYPMVAADGHVVWLRDLVRVFCNATHGHSERRGGADPLAAPDPRADAARGVHPVRRAPD